jgi:hypothetical protein
MELKPVVEVIGPIATELKKTEGNHIRFLLFNGSPEDTVELSFSITLQKSLLGKSGLTLEPEKTTITLAPGEFSELKFGVVGAPSAKKDSIDGQIKIISNIVKQKGSGFDVLRTLTDILIPFGGVMVDLLRKPFTKADASKDFTLQVGS